MICKHPRKISCAVPNGESIYIKKSMCALCLQPLVTVVKLRINGIQSGRWAVMVPGFRSEYFINNFAALIFANYVGRVGPEKVMVKL